MNLQDTESDNRGVKTKKTSLYQNFVKQEMKKRPADVKPKDYMKTIGKRWRSSKK